MPAATTLSRGAYNEVMDDLDHEAGEVGDGAFRRAPIHELCACGEAASERCLRCEVPLCREHDPVFGHRCADCEDAYASLLRDRKIHPLTGLQLLLSYAVGVGGVVGAWYLIDWLGWGQSKPGGYISLRDWMMLLVVIPASILPLIAIHWRRIRLRGAFLHERPGRQRLRLSRQALRAERTSLGERKPAPTVGNSFAIAGLILTLIFFIPALPAIGFALGLVAYRGRRRHQTGEGQVKLAIAAILIGLISNAVQIFFVVWAIR
jgi:hypothetical protein